MRWGEGRRKVQRKEGRKEDSLEIKARGALIFEAQCTSWLLSMIKEHSVDKQNSDRDWKRTEESLSNAF